MPALVTAQGCITMLSNSVYVCEGGGAKVQDRAAQGPGPQSGKHGCEILTPGVWNESDTKRSPILHIYAIFQPAGPLRTVITWLFAASLQPVEIGPFPPLADDRPTFEKKRK